MTETTSDAEESTVQSTGDESASGMDTPEPGADEKSTNRQGRSGRDERYRQRLRETEAERDTLLQRLQGMQRNEVQRLVSDRLADPADLWRDANLEDMLDDDGNIDTAKVDAHISTLLEEHPHWAADKPKTPSGALKSGAMAPSAPRRDPWLTAFTPKRRD